MRWLARRLPVALAFTFVAATLRAQEAPAVPEPAPQEAPAETTTPPSEPAAPAPGPVGPSNPAFEDGAAGSAPPGWSFRSSCGGTCSLTAEGPFAGAQAAVVDVRQPTAGQRFSNLSQSFAADELRGKRVRYRAAVKAADLDEGSTVQLWFRVDLPDDAEGKSRFGGFDNMDDRPIRNGDWATHDVVLDVAADASRIVFGVFLLGKGRAWLDDVTFTVVGDDVAVTGGSRPTARGSGMDPRVAKALATAEQAPQQSFWTWWLLLPLLAVTLFVVGMWPEPRSAGGVSLPIQLPRPRTGALRRFALRFTVVYWLLYCLPGPFPDLVASIPEVGPGWRAALGGWHQPWMELATAWTARHVFGIDGELVPPNGSGDTTMGYLFALDGFVLAIAIALVWTLLVGRWPRRDVSVDLLRSYLRYVLAFAMLSYGLAKVSIEHNQFPEIGDWRLAKTWGETSPMGVVWSFMGASRPYTVFAGLGEVLAALLLIWRHTALLGALVAFGVMANVVMLNFCYDVPVKLYSVHLLLMAVVVLLPDARRLLALLVLHRTSDDPGTPSVWRGPIARWLRWPPKLAVITVGVALPVWGTAVEVGQHLRAAAAEASPAEPPPAASPADAAPAHAAESDPLLTRRGFRWINEVPFHR